MVTPSGSKYWRLKYFFAGKEKLLAVGVYPEVTLADARERRRKHGRCSLLVTIQRQAKKEAKRLTTLKSANAFEVVAREWFEKRKHEWKETSTRTTLARLEQHILPKLGQRPIADITAAGRACHATRS